MDLLDLTKCTTNEEVCALVKERVGTVSFSDLLKEVEKEFIFQTKAVKAIYTGLSMNMNTYLSGPGGMGKTSLIKWVLNFYGIPYSVIIGYKDMPVDELLGIPNMKKLLEDSKYEINFKDSVFCNPGVLVFEEAADILPSTVMALKDILTEKGYRDKNGVTPSLISSVVIAANKSAEDIADDASKRAFYIDRFPIRVNVEWEKYNLNSYYHFLSLKFPDENKQKIGFLARLFEYNFTKANMTISPRQAIDISTVYFNSGVSFLSSFKIDLSEINYLLLEAKKEEEVLSFKDYLSRIQETIENTSEDDRWKIILYVDYELRKLETTADTFLVLNSFKKNLHKQLSKCFMPLDVYEKVDEIILKLKLK